MPGTYNQGGDKIQPVTKQATTARARITVRGRVQMVGYRAFAIRNAEKVMGTVGNRPDGSVEAIAEGSRADVEAFIERLHAGPPASRVESVEVTWETPSGTYTSMRIA